VEGGIMMTKKLLYAMLITCIAILTTALNATVVSGGEWNGDPSCARPFEKSKLNGKEPVALEAFSVGNSLLNSYIDKTSRSRDILEQAIQRYDKAIRLKPDFAAAYFNKGVCLIRKYSGWGNSSERRSHLISTEEVFDRVLELRPACSDALFAKGQAQYRIGAKGLSPSTPEWRSAADRALSTLNAVISRFPGTVAANNASNQIRMIRFHFDRSISNPSSPPVQVPVRIDTEYVKNIEKVAKKAIEKIKTGIIREKVTEIHNRGGGRYYESGKVENTHGLVLHKYDFSILATDIQKDYTFRSLLFEFKYDGQRITHTKLGLPSSEIVAKIGSVEELKATIIEHKNIKVTLTMLDAKSGSRSTNYESITIKLVTEVID
jgi:tetratricopeptide (TPR) repeat protein